MKTLRIKNKAELIQKYDGKIYEIADFSGNPMFDVLDDDYSYLVDNDIVNSDNQRFKNPMSGFWMKYYKDKYALEIIFTDDHNIEKMARNALITTIKDYCCKVGKIDDNNDDICLHYINLTKDNKITPTSEFCREWIITKVGYDPNGEDNKHSGVLIWVESLNECQQFTEHKQ